MSFFPLKFYEFLIMPRKILFLVFLACSFFSQVFAGDVSVSNAFLAAESVNGKVSVWQLENGQKKGGPFAGFQLPNDETTFFTLSAPDDQPFLIVTVSPKVTAEKRIVKSVLLPEITLSEAYAPDGCKALGTAGLTDVDGHKGSYMFLAVAEPVSRQGIVAAWVTSHKGSGIVFSGKTDDGKNVTIQPELQYGRYEIDSSAVPEPEVFVLGAFDDCLDGLERYADAIAKVHKIQMKPQISGYCTWYSNKFGGAGTEASTREFADAALEKLVPFGMRYFQIDDHWQLGKGGLNGPAKNFTGHNPSGPYPSGMKPTAEYLNAKGLIAGIWFMPYSGNWNDPWYADKQEWFVKSAIDYPAPGEKNTRRFSGINQKKGAPYETFWGGTSLDMTDPNVEKYVHEEVDQIANQWGYKYFKYDGMWTAMACEQLYVNDEYLPDDLGLQIFDDMTKTNVEIYRKGLKMVRAAAGDDVFILGCNVSQNMRTMGASYGLVDAMRIGPDNGSSWGGICAGPVRGTARWFFNGRVWYNDPDPVYVRDSIPLAHAQLITSWAAITGQLFAFSDWLPELSDERVNVLQRTIAPVRLYTARPLDVFESKLANLWRLTKPGNETVIFGLFNWSENEPLKIQKSLKELGLDENVTYVGFDFWANAFVPPFRHELDCELPGGSCRVLALTRMAADRPTLAGTSRHVASPLFEVKNVNWNAETLTLSGTSDVVANDPYELRLVLPEGLKVSENQTKNLKITAEGRTLRVSFTPKKSGEVNWEIRFEKGASPIPAPVKVQNLAGKADYSKLTLHWDETPNYGFVLTKKASDGTVRKVFSLNGTQFTDYEVKTGETWTYQLQSVGWGGELSPEVTVNVKMPDAIIMPPLPPMPDVDLTEQNPQKVKSGWGSPKKNLSVAGNPLKLNGKTYEKGFGVHAYSSLTFDVPVGSKRFVAVAGLDDFHVKDPRRSVIVKVWTDVCEMGEPQVLAAESPLLSNETVNHWHFDVPLDARVKQIRLEVTDAEDGIACDHVDWVDVGFIK